MFTYEYHNRNYRANDEYKDLFKSYFDIEDAKTLKRAKLSLSDYNSIPALLHAIAQNGVAQTFITPIAEWFKRNKCKVEFDENKVNYIITMEEKKHG